MSIFTVNGMAHEVQASLETWGQLLAVLEHGDGPARIVVAAVRFDGVDQPTFRDPEALGLDLRLAAPIDVELSTTGELVASARETALGGLDALAESARQAAEAFRLHDLPRAHRGLADFVATFQLLTTLTAALGRSDTSGLPSVDTSGAECLDRLNSSLGSLIDFDVNQDWISVADVLEYEIADLLPQWAALVRDAGACRPVGIASELGSAS
jgi:hypothetical protein